MVKEAVKFKGVNSVGEIKMFSAKSKKKAAQRAVKQGYTISE